MPYHRFVNNTLPKPQDGTYNPVSDYEHLPVLRLETVVENISHLVPGVEGYVSTSKKNCNQNSTLLTWDESAAIYLYTMPVPFYSTLNTTLRDANRQVLRPWLAFLKLLITALEKLPPTQATIWRAVDYDARSKFVDNDLYTWWGITSCSMDTDIVQQYLGESGTLFAIETAHGKDVSMFSAVSDEKEVILMPGTSVRAKSQSLNYENRLFLIHLEEINPQSKSNFESNQLFEQIKEKYRRNNRIERFMNPAVSFPIEQSYINLSIVGTKEQREKEKRLQNIQHATAVIGAYEDIYCAETAIDVKDIFNTCKGHEKRVLVFGRAGIGKSTFCQYIAYQWAMGSYWSQYELLALISLRQLTVHRYPHNKNYSLMDLVRKEVFPLDLTDKEEEQLKKQFDVRKTLWILDGYDEIVQNIPPHMKPLLEQLLKTPHHIITSRPYMNTLSYNVQMEIIGFTDENIENYIQNFFKQMKDEVDDATIKSGNLLAFLTSNPSIWGVAHIPVNLELICSLWSNEDWSEIKQLTMTRLYTMMIEWLCRRYLTAQGFAIQKISTDQMYQYCQKELLFLESLAFRAMESNNILIQPALLKKASDETQISSRDYSHILNMGILKSLNKQGTGTQIETNKTHYFVHLSFQEYFAARYLINALKGSQAEKSVEFIRHHKYNQRFTLLFSFMAGLLSEEDTDLWLDTFWDALLGPPVDLVGIRHMQLIIACTEETNSATTLSRRSTLLEWIAECLEYCFIPETEIIYNHLLHSLQRSQSIACDQVVINVLIASLQHHDVVRKWKVLRFICLLKIANPSIALITSITARLDDEDEEVRGHACDALAKIGEKSTTNEVITKLMSALEDRSILVTVRACKALGEIGEKAASKEVISKLVNALEDPNEWVRQCACEALGKISTKAATKEVISKLVSALEDQDERVRVLACEALGKIGEIAVTNEVISKLMNALEDRSANVKSYACVALGKIGEKAATEEVISKLMNALENENRSIRNGACEALRKMGAKVATNEVVSKLLSTLEDQSEWDSESWVALDLFSANACSALGRINDKVAINELITKLMSVLTDENEKVRRYACSALENLGEKAATNEVISKLVSAVSDKSELVRSDACSALGKIGEKITTKEAITKLMSALEDPSAYVRRHACFALGNIGGKVVTNEVITELVTLVNSGQRGVPPPERVFKNLLSSSFAIEQLNPKIITQFFLRNYNSHGFENVSENDLINVFDETKNLGWLSAVASLALFKGTAVIPIKDKLMMYGNEEPVELLGKSAQFRAQLIEAFIVQAKQFHLHLQMSLKNLK